MLTDKASYKQGRRTELSLLRAIELFGWQAKDRSGGKQIDLLVTFPYLFGIEIKDEDNFADSGNICIETFQGEPRRPSGLMISATQFFVHTLGAMSIVYSTPHMQRCVAGAIEAGRLTERVFANADNHNGGVIVKRSKLTWRSRWVDECPRNLVVGAMDSLITRLGIRGELEAAADEYSRTAAYAVRATGRPRPQGGRGESHQDHRLEGREADRRPDGQESHPVRWRDDRPGPGMARLSEDVAGGPGEVACVPDLQSCGGGEAVSKEERS